MRYHAKGIHNQLNQSTSSTLSLNFNPLLPTFVAVKTLKGTSLNQKLVCTVELLIICNNIGCFADDEMKELIKESIKMRKFDHHNVLCLIGICLDAGPAPYIVMPFMSNGSLLSYLKKERSALIISHDSDEDVVWLQN